VQKYSLNVDKSAKQISGYLGIGPQRSNGFTLIELMIVVVVMAVLLAVAVPSFTAHIQRGEMKSSLANLITAIAYARSQATRLKTTVHVHSKNSTDWSGGWCVTTNADDCGTGTELLRDFDGTNSINLAGNASTSSYSFTPRGFLSSTTNATHISLCGDQDEGKKITVLALGQALAQKCDCNSSKVCSS